MSKLEKIFETSYEHLELLIRTDNGKLLYVVGAEKLVVSSPRLPKYEVYSCEYDPIEDIASSIHEVDYSFFTWEESLATLNYLIEGLDDAIECEKERNNGDLCNF
jgi:hypothetical protein